MGVVKCAQCGKFIDESEAIFKEIDDSHETSYCVVCSPDDLFSDDDTYDPDDDSYDETE